MQWKDSIQTPIEIGYYAYNEKYHLDFKSLAKGIDPNSSSKIIEVIQPYLDDVIESEKDILYYVHGYSADSKWYQRFTNSRLQKHVYTKDSSPYGLIINLVWNSDPVYIREMKRSTRKGELFGEVIKSIDRYLKADYIPNSPSILCHSMGNRLLGGILNVIDNANTGGPFFDNIVMACPDLESNTINQDRVFQNLDSLSQHVTIYVHNNDRVLTIATQINNSDRLGHTGPANWDELSDNITIVDASLIADNEDLGSKFSNHRYFYASPSGREDLAVSLGIIQKREKTSREVLDRPFRYVIKSH